MKLHLTRSAEKAMTSLFFTCTLFLFANSHPISSHSEEDKISLPIDSLSSLDMLNVDKVLFPEILQSIIFDDNIEVGNSAHSDSAHTLTSSKTKRFDFGFAGLDTYDAIHRALGQGSQRGRVNGATLDMLMKMRRHG